MKCDVRKVIKAVLLKIKVLKDGLWFFRCVLSFLLSFIITIMIDAVAIFSKLILPNNEKNFSDKESVCITSLTFRGVLRTLPST